MIKRIGVLLIGLATSCYADTSGVFVGGGFGYGMQQQDFQNNAATLGSPALRLQAGYQFADWIDAEFGWNYVTQGSNWNNLGQPSTTIYDLAFLPGFTIPATPVGIFIRLGVDSVSANLNNSWYNQLISSANTNFEYGAGVKVSIPDTRTFIRAEYINYGAALNNGNTSITTTATAILIDAGYVF